jgi:ADP-heptose:LPS heptosyltransferase
LLKVNFVKKVIIWKINGLGDFVAYIPTIRILVNEIGINNVFFVLSPVSYNLLSEFYQPNYYFVIDKNKFDSLYKHPKTFFRLFFRLKQFSAQYSLISYDDSSISYILSYLLNIKYRCGFISKISRFNFLLNKKIPLFENENIYLINFRILSFVISSHLLDNHKIKSCFNFFRTQFLNTHFLNDNYVLIHPFAQFSYREFELKKFIDVARFISCKYNLKVIFIGEAKHKSIFCNYEFDFFDNLSFDFFFKLMANAKLFIGNNSGPMHIAILCQTPFISIEGPSAKNWGPPDFLDFKYIRFNKNVYCSPCESLLAVPKKCLNINSPNLCLASISVQDIIEKISFILDN